MPDIPKILTLPEGKTVEFKRDLSSLKPILKTLVAFANTAGGTLVIGKEDDGTIVGVDDVFEAEERLANTISDNICPTLMPEIEVISHESKSLLAVSVAHWRGPFYLKAKGPEQGVYIRLGSTNRVASPELLAELKRSMSNLSFDQMACPDVAANGLDEKRMEKAFSSVGKKLTEADLITLGILVPHSGQLVCSNGGLILFGQDHLRQRYFPNTTVRCARFRGIDKVDFIDQYDVEGSVLDAMEEVPNFIKRNTRLAAKIEGAQRENIPEYSPIALREVLTNALAHADYSINGMNPRVAIYSDRLEIESPGMLPFGYTLEDFIAGISHVRNKVIARVFRELQLMEEWGTGYKRVVNACQKGGYAIPDWSEIGTTVRVTFQPNPATQEEPERKKQAEPEELLPRQQEILDIFRQQGKMLSAKEIHQKLHSPISERTLRLDLQALKEQGHLEKRGSGPSTFWQLAS